MFVRTWEAAALWALAAAALVCAPEAARAQEVTAGDGWVEASESEARAYAVVKNPTMYDVYLVAASSDAAEKVELRRGGEAVREITVPAYGSVAMTAEGFHLALVGLAEPLAKNDEISLTLTTDGAKKLKLQAVAREE